MASGLVRCGQCGQANRVPAAAVGIPRCGTCHQPLPWIAVADDATFGDVADAAKIPVASMQIARPTLDDVLLTLTDHSLRDDPAPGPRRGA